MVRGVGAISDKAIVPFDGKVYFLSDDGFFVTDGNKVTHLSAALDDWVRLLPQAHLGHCFLGHIVSSTHHVRHSAPPGIVF